MPKRGENIYKRKDERWEGRYKMGMDYTGKPIYKSVYAHSYLECKNKLKGIFKENAVATDDPRYSTLTFIEICHQWLLQIKPAIKDSSFAVYHNVITKHMSTYFKKRRLSEINKDMVNDFVVMLRKNDKKNGKQPFSTNTVNKILIILKAVLSFLEKEHSVRIPFVNLMMLKQEENNEEILSVYEWEQLAKVLSVSRDETATAIAIAMYTGMRVGEICALKKKDMDFNEKTIHVQRTVQRIKNIGGEADSRTRLVISKPKSTKSLRKIPMPDILFEKLKIVCAEKEEDAFILGIEDKKVLEPRTLQYRFKSFLKKAGIRDLHFHSLRHAFATRCVEKNIDIKTLSEILGHASIKITLEKYVHSSMEFKRIQINRLEEAI